jgi:acyl dehydratase
MTIDSNKLAGLTAGPHRVDYSRTDARRYALTIGMGSDPMFDPELDFVTDRPGFRTVPTMATIFADVIMDLTLACKLERPELALHGQQKLELLRPLPDAASLEITGSIPALYDRGPDKGAEIHMQAEARVAGGEEPVWRATYVTIARGDGGFGGQPPGRPERVPAPGRGADQEWSYRIPPNQALLYSLNGDPNPIHVQPRIARKAGFERPILHGLCTYGMACRALLACCVDFDSDRIRRFDARFTAPVTPGDELLFEFWRESPGILFQVTSRDLGRPVIKDGWCELSQGAR